jgi:hypothetical protein
VVACSTQAASGTGGAGGAAQQATSTSQASTSASTGASTTSSGTGGGPTGTPTFVVAGYDLRRVTSTDGMTWSNDVSDPPDPNDNIGDGIAFGRGLVAVVAHSGLVTSRDGVNWTKVGAPLPQAWPGLGGGQVVFTGDEFLIIAGSSSFDSPDGVAWTEHTSSAGATHWKGLAFGNGHFVAVGDSNAAGGDRKASEDGITWHDYVEGGPALRALAFGNGVFVTVGAQGHVETSSDGATWQDHGDPALGDLSNLVFADGAFLTCAYPKCFTSPDGVAWTPHDAQSPPDGPITHGLGLYLSITWESNILVSSDGFAWTKAWSGAQGTPALASVGFGLLGP